jgi:DNA invertase Pin-like site-specific DNA recombinase
MRASIRDIVATIAFGNIVCRSTARGDEMATDNELVRNILLALLSSLAKLEAQKISDRTKAGMARAKANGIKIGRPKLGIEIRQKIAQRAKKGETHARPACSV